MSAALPSLCSRCELTLPCPASPLLPAFSRHAALLSRVSMLVNHSEAKLAVFRSVVSSFRSGQNGSRDVIDTIYNVLNRDVKATVMVVKAVEGLLIGVDQEKRSELLNAIGNWSLAVSSTRLPFLSPKSDPLSLSRVIAEDQRVPFPRSPRLEPQLRWDHHRTGHRRQENHQRPLGNLPPSLGPRRGCCFYLWFVYQWQRPRWTLQLAPFRSSAHLSFPRLLLSNHRSRPPRPRVHCLGLLPSLLCTPTLLLLSFPTPSRRRPSPSLATRPHVRARLLIRPPRILPVFGGSETNEARVGSGLPESAEWDRGEQGGRGEEGTVRETEPADGEHPEDHRDEEGGAGAGLGGRRRGSQWEWGKYAGGKWERRRWREEEE